MEGILIGQAAQMACLLEVSAPKPGNVNRENDFSDTNFEDFILSAAAIGPVFAQACEITVGQIILNAIQATRTVVNTNTNLGMVMILAPLAKAAAMGSHTSMRSRVGQVLKNLTIQDTRLTYEAIRLAVPGGMGSVDQADVHDRAVDIPLCSTMELARERDAIAREYATDYAITFGCGLPALESSLEKNTVVPQTIVQTFLEILAHVPDTLIARKNGWDLARHVTDLALSVVKDGGVYESPEGVIELDRYLRDPDHRLNPGTTADLVCAALFIYLVEHDLVVAPQM